MRINADFTIQRSTWVTSSYEGIATRIVKITEETSKFKFSKENSVSYDRGICGPKKNMRDVYRYDLLRIHLWALLLDRMHEDWKWGSITISHEYSVAREATQENECNIPLPTERRIGDPQQSAVPDICIALCYGLAAVVAAAVRNEIRNAWRCTLPLTFPAAVSR